MGRTEKLGVLDGLNAISRDDRTDVAFLPTNRDI